MLWIFRNLDEPVAENILGLVARQLCVRLLHLVHRSLERGLIADHLRGTTSLFAALDVKTGKVIGRLHHRHRAREFRKFLEAIDESTPQDLDLHVILDNSSIHKTPEIRRWLLRHPRFLSLHVDEFVLDQSRGALVRASE